MTPKLHHKSIQPAPDEALAARVREKLPCLYVNECAPKGSLCERCEMRPAVLALVVEVRREALIDLREYGRHKKACGTADFGDCTCGFAAALRGAR